MSELGKNSNNLLGTDDLVPLNSLDDITEYMDVLGANDLTDLLNTLTDRINDPSTNLVVTSKHIISLIVALLANGTKLIGPIPGNKSVGEYISEFLEKLEDVVNTNLLLTASIQALGVGLYNTKDNGLPSNFEYNSKTKLLTFRLGEIVALLVRDRNFLMENIGSKPVSVDLSGVIQPKKALIFRIVVHTNKTNTAEVEFLKSISIFDLELDTNSHGFFILEEKVEEEIATYNTLINQKDTFHIFTFTANFSDSLTPSITSSAFVRTYEPIKPFTYLYHNLLKSLNGDGLVLNIPKGFTKDVTPLFIRQIINNKINIVSGTIPATAMIYILPSGLQYTNDVNFEQDYLYKWEKSSIIGDNKITVNPLYRNVYDESLAMTEEVILYCTGFTNLDGTPCIVNINLDYIQDNPNQLMSVTCRIDSVLHDNAFIYPLNTGVIYKDPLFFEESSKPLAVDEYTEVYNHIFGGFSARSLKDKSIEDRKLNDKTITERSIADKAIDNRHMNWFVNDDPNKPQFPINNMKDNLLGNRIDYGIGNVFTNTLRNTMFSVFKVPRICISETNPSDAVCMSWTSVAANKALGVNISDYKVDYTECTNDGAVPLARQKIIRDGSFYTHGVIIHKNFAAKHQNDVGATALLERSCEKANAAFSYVYKSISQIVETGMIILSSNPALMGDKDVTRQRCDVGMSVFRENATRIPIVKLFDVSGNSGVSLSTDRLHASSGNDLSDAYPISLLLGSGDTEHKTYEHGWYYGIDSENLVIGKYTNQSIPLGFVNHKPSIMMGDTDVEHFPKALAGLIEIRKEQIIKFDNVRVSVMGSYLEPYGEFDFTLIMTRKRTINSVARILHHNSTKCINGDQFILVELL